jgi:hypothetical protein
MSEARRGSSLDSRSTAVQTLSGVSLPMKLGASVKSKGLSRMMSVSTQISSVFRNITKRK